MWISVKEKLPPEKQMVWLWDGKNYVCLGGRFFLANEGWIWAKSDGIFFDENGEIASDCEFEDLDVKYWHELPKLKL